MRRTRPGDERALSDIIGTIILLGVTISFVGAAAIQMAPPSEPQAPLRLAMSATSDGASVHLLHLGGAALDEGSLMVRVAVNGIVVQATPPGPSGASWSVGETLVVPLDAPLGSGTAEVTVAHTRLGRVLAGSAVTTSVAPVTVSPVGFRLDVLLDGEANATVVAPGQVLAEVVVTHPDGRKMIHHAYADLSAVTGPAWVGLRDDGTHGDAVAGDGVWSAILDVPFSSPKGPQRIAFTAVDLPGASARASALVRVV